jgi:hypothetical protein
MNIVTIKIVRCVVLAKTVFYNTFLMYLNSDPMGLHLLIEHQSLLKIIFSILMDQDFLKEGRY